jgi:hypothetical protein
MVREEKYRIAKWDKKLDPGIIKTIWENIKDVVKEITESGLIKETQTDLIVKDVLKDFNVPSLHHGYYIIFGRQLANIVKRFSGTTLQNYANLIASYWYWQGLNEQVLKAIAQRFNLQVQIIKQVGKEIEYITNYYLIIFEKLKSAVWFNTFFNFAKEKIFKANLKANYKLYFNVCRCKQQTFSTFLVCKAIKNFAKQKVLKPSIFISYRAYLKTRVGRPV